MITNFPLLKHRKKLIVWLFEKSQRIYTKYFKKNKPWQLTKRDLLLYDKNTLGYGLGIFLTNNGFEVIPKAERHDAYHVLTGYQSKEEDEIALQYLCFGNGKRSPYLFSVITLGTLILPEYLNHYKTSYQIGKQTHPFYNLDFKGLLKNDLKQLQKALFTKTYFYEKLS